MGVSLKAKAKALTYYDKYQMFSSAGFGVLKQFSENVLESEELKHFFSVYKGSWSAEDTKTIAELLSKITRKQVADFKKASRDEIVKSPIVTCAHCDGVGTTELDSFDKPQYINFCVDCRGLGVTRDTFDIGEYLNFLDIERLAGFLEKSGGISVS
jgi:DnaJ-class molecular chaperone